MADRTTIEWTDATWNPVTGCTKVSPGCDHCYAERLTQRRGGDFSKVTLHWDRIAQPLRWKKPRRIFVCSMSDLFHREVPVGFLTHVFQTMAECPQHIFQILTKRPGRMAWFAKQLAVPWPENVWAGTSVESAKYLPRLDVLARVPARVRFVSAEPLLGPLDMRPWLDYQVCTCDASGGHDWGCGEPFLNWVITGGESGPGFRPPDPAWFQSLRDQCQTANVPFFFKQWGGLRPGGTALLDGREWREMPHGDRALATPALSEAEGSRVPIEAP